MRLAPYIRYVFLFGLFYGLPLQAQLYRHGSASQKLMAKADSVIHLAQSSQLVYYHDSTSSYLYYHNLLDSLYLVSKVDVIKSDDLPIPVRERGPEIWFKDQNHEYFAWHKLSQEQRILDIKELEQSVEEGERFVELQKLVIYLFATPQDTFLSLQDSEQEYRLLFSISGGFADAKVSMIRNFSIDRIKSDSSLYTVKGLRSHPLKHRNSGFYSKNPGHQIYIYPGISGIFNISSDPSFWSNRIVLHSIYLESHLEKSKQNQGFGDFSKMKEAPKVSSFQNGKYLMVDILSITQVGNQTDFGQVTTLFLERYNAAP